MAGGGTVVLLSNPDRFAGPAARAALEAHGRIDVLVSNDAFPVIRRARRTRSATMGSRSCGSGAERVFAVHKQRYGLGRTRFPGRAKNMTFCGLAAIAPDIRKGGMFLRLHGRAQPVAGG